MLRCNLKELFPLAMTPGVDGFRAEIQLTWDEFSRMRNSLFDALHFLRFTLIGTGLLPLPAANCQSSVAHIFSNWHLQSRSGFPVGLHHLLVVRCGLSAIFNGKGRTVAFWDAAGCLGGRATERKPWLGSGQFFQAHRDQGVKMCLWRLVWLRAWRKDATLRGHSIPMARPLSASCQKPDQFANGCLFPCAGHARSVRQVLAEADLQVIGPAPSEKH